MVTLWLTLLTQIATIIANRLALAKMRADMATTDDEKKRAIDEGLIVADSMHKIFDKVSGQIDSLKGALTSAPTDASPGQH